MNPAPALPARLPALRQELAIHPGPRDAQGAPTWTLHDPADNRFFQLRWPAFEMLSRWRLGEPRALIAAIRRETTLDASEAEVAAMLEFLDRHHLLAAGHAAGSERLLRAAQARRTSKAMWLLKHYLFFRIPLVRPMPALRAVMPYLAWLYAPAFWWAIGGAGLVGLYLAAQRWDGFVHTFSAYSGWSAALGIGIALSLGKVAHELGHALTAVRYGCRVPSMGVAFLVLVPVLYTDTNEAWKLSSRSQRLRIGAAGMAAEIALAACATLAWSFLPDGPLRAGVFLLATSTWLITLAINLSPFMRFDGYFLLSDWLEMPNLHERAFALGRWRLRAWLFGWGDAPPEDLPPRRRRMLIAFAYATWLYRLILFVGIALLVYHLFFKALGVLLLAVELAWFVALPIARELGVWRRMRSRMRWNPALRRSLALGALGLAVAVVPWPRGVRVPAVLQASQAQWLYAPARTQVRQHHARFGRSVAAGDVLVELDAPDLRHELALASARERQLRQQIARQAFDERQQAQGNTLRQRLDAAVAEVAGLRAIAGQLTLRAEFPGRVVAVNPALHAGAWLPRGEALVQVASTDGTRVQAYVGEQDVAHLAAGATARFLADEPALPRVDCRVEGVDRLALTELDQPAVASPYGGPVPARLDGGRRLVPLDSVFRLRLARCTGIAGVAREYTGIATIGNERRSFLQSWIRAILALARREASL